MGQRILNWGILFLCISFHDFGDTSILKTGIHPDSPENANWKYLGYKG